MTIVDPSHPPDSNPKTRYGIRKVPLHLVPPVAVAQMACAFRDGGAKYGPYNFRDEKVSASVYYAAALRHLTAWWDGEDLASDSGEHHLAHAMACMAIVLDGQGSEFLNDDRPTKGSMAKFIADYDTRMKEKVPQS